jgi:glycosyltransferase involved in cell wall biosynthesis
MTNKPVRVTVVTAGHLSTSPRMLKAADALAAVGYRVRVISTRHLPWAVGADREVRRLREAAWTWATVDYERDADAFARVRTGLRLRGAKLAARTLGPSRCPRSLAAAAWSRAHRELVRAAVREPVDLLYGGGAALAAVAEAGRKMGVPYAIDLEDFHSAEQVDSPAATLSHALATLIERDVLPGAVFLTASSPGIAAAYADRYGVSPIVVHNTFPLPAKPPDVHPHPERRLRLYWFSQTIGPGRGLEDAVSAMALAAVPGELHLRGLAITGYVESLRRLAAQGAPRLEIVPHDPAPPDTMVDLCADYDVGLSLERGPVLNRLLCLTNKAFTYILGGLAVAFTDTPGQRPLARDLGDGSLLYAPGDVASLAAGLRRWADDTRLLERARTASWLAARRRWHWEHLDERGALIRACTAGLAAHPACAS